MFVKRRTEFAKKMKHIDAEAKEAAKRRTEFANNRLGMMKRIDAEAKEAAKRATEMAKDGGSCSSIRDFIMSQK